MLGLADRRGHGERGRGLGAAEESQAGLVGKPVGLERIDFPLGPHEVLERIAPPTITWNDVIKVAAVLTDVFARVLADATSRARIAVRLTRGTRIGIRLNCVEMMTVGTRIRSFVVETTKSNSRTGNLIHSSQATGFK